MWPGKMQVLPNPEAVAVEACRIIAAAAQESIRERGVFRLVLAGGGTPSRAYELLAATAQDWAAWEIFWGDERCLPANHPERNSHMAEEVWLGRVAIPTGRIHPIPAELGASQASGIYARTIIDKQPFDLVILGMGTDGHTASLFPGGPDNAAPVIAVHDAPKPPADRVSLSQQTLKNCRSQLVLLTGTGKGHALAAWNRGDDLPVARVVRNDACLLLDEAALDCD